jgi:hypothetical protein
MRHQTFPPSHSHPVTSSPKIFSQSCGLSSHSFSWARRSSSSPPPPPPPAHASFPAPAAGLQQVVPQVPNFFLLSSLMFWCFRFIDLRILVADGQICVRTTGSTRRWLDPRVEGPDPRGQQLARLRLLAFPAFGLPAALPVLLTSSRPVRPSQDVRRSSWAPLPTPLWYEVALLKYHIVFR